MQEPTTPPIDAPDFNGLSPEAFHGGNEMLTIWDRLGPAVRREMLSHLVRRMGNDVLGNDYHHEHGEAATEAEASVIDEQLRAIGSDLRESAEHFESAAVSRPEQRKRFREMRGDL